MMARAKFFISLPQELGWPFSCLIYSQFVTKLCLSRIANWAWQYAMQSTGFLCFAMILRNAKGLALC
jgi:hypothetical protein